MSFNSDDAPSPNIESILNKTSLKWIFVGGKGGVGKTTCSCSLAIQLSKCRDRVLLISTDPAHNVSDAFDQKVGKIPTLIKGFKNLYAMEIDPTVNLTELELNCLGENEQAEAANFRKLIGELMNNFPGMDEYTSYTEVFRLVDSMDYSVVVFDTAPTGHTLRLLAFPEMMEKGLGNLLNLKNQFGPILNQVCGWIGLGDQTNEATRLLEEKMPLVKKITNQFKNPDQTTFMCVCIPEFLSLYETERLVQELHVQNIHVNHIVVNQLLFPNAAVHCTMCNARTKIQNKYLSEIEDLYDDMHIIKMPLLEYEIRGVEKVSKFSNYLVNPHKP